MLLYVIRLAARDYTLNRQKDRKISFTPAWAPKNTRRYKFAKDASEK
jgi:hypothetical protein